MTSDITVPFHRTALSPNQQEYVHSSFQSGQVSGDGPFTKKTTALLQTITQCPKVYLTTSCTHALEMTGLLLRLQPGDEVILPSFTFVSTANAFVLRGAVPRFADICPDTLDIDPRSIEKLLSPRTKAVVVVHYAGVACDMESIFSLCRDRKVPVIEDNAHGLFGSYKGKPLGSLGSLSTLSFHGTKNISCGEGGALLVNDPKLAQRAEILREKGTNRSQFFRGEVDKYTWVDIGSSYLIADSLAACLLAQLQDAASIQDRRQRIWRRYVKELTPWAQKQGFQLPHIPPDATPAYHLFFMLARSKDGQQRFLRYLRSKGVHATFHYQPLHTAPFAQQFPQKQPCPITQSVAERIIRLPLYPDLTERDQTTVINAVTSFTG